MTDPRIASFHAESEKVLQFFQSECGKLQTGRANPSLVEGIDVEAYGQKMQMKAVAGISVPDARSIVIQPWDKSVLGAIEKAIQIANIGINPVNDGVLIRLNLPPMTEERRKELQKVVQKLAEEARISVRQARQKVHDQLKQEKDEDLREGLENTLQKDVDAANAKIDAIKAKKEEEVMKV